MNALEQLRTMTTVVADTGDIYAIRKSRPQDATTNPTLILAAAQQPEYRPLFDDAVSYGAQRGATTDEKVRLALDKLSVNFGREILSIIPGRVSTEVDARYSFDVAQIVFQAQSLINLYESAGIEQERVLIKVAATWEGIEAISQLNGSDIHCNATLVFSDVQAIAAAQAGVKLISPFVGRITDYRKKEDKRDAFPVDEDPGVLSVRSIYYFLRKHGYPTEVMGASFRSADQVLALAGCDLLTISPDYLNKLEGMDMPVLRMLSPERAEMECKQEDPEIEEGGFRWRMNEDKMATDLLSDGIRRFNADARKLENLIRIEVERRAA